MSFCVLSPCLLKNEDGDFCESEELLNSFSITINFILNNLNIKLLVHEQSVLFRLYPFIPPFNDVSLATYFAANIANNLKILLADGFIVYDSDVKRRIGSIDWEIDDSYVSVDEHECELLCQCVAFVDSNIIEFVGKTNYRCSDKISITINQNIHTVDIVKDIYTDLTGHFDKYIEINNANALKEVFPNKHICKKLVRQIPDERDSSVYHKYADVIAKRNGYTRMPHDSRWHKDNAPHYCRMDKEYIIVLDDVHGTFEVFNNTTKDPTYINEYGFNGELVSTKTSDPETHKFFRQ